MNIILLEPFYSGSHKQWADGFKKFSSHSVDILHLPGRHWKWRMHGGAISLAKQFFELDYTPDLILGTSMLDFTTFLSLIRATSARIPSALYVHENQLTYPWSPQDRDVKHKRDNHYAFINYTSALVSDRVFFNSEYHRNSFLDALPAFLNQFPDKREKELIQDIAGNSEVLYLGLDLSRFDVFQASYENKKPIILWNHRWEFDKNPEEFFEALFLLKEQNHEFELVVLGEQNEMIPSIFNKAKEVLNEQIIHWGYVPDFETYAYWLWKADILPVTSNQDFFGGSIVEALYCNCYPLLPNRLAYPEHVSEEFLYAPSELYSKLVNALSMAKQSKLTFQSSVMRYDWKNSIDRYDQRLEEVVTFATRNKHR